MRKEESRGLAGHSGGDETTQQVYSPASNLSRLQDLIASLLLMTENPNLDATDRAAVWGSFALLLERYV